MMEDRTNDDKCSTAPQDAIKLRMQGGIVGTVMEDVSQLATESATKVMGEAQVFSQDVRTDHIRNDEVTEELSRDMYQEVAQALFSALTIYGYTDLRAISRQPPDGVELRGDASKLHALLNPPTPRLDIIKIFEDNVDVVKDNIGCARTELYMSAIESLIEDMQVRQAVKKEAHTLGSLSMDKSSSHHKRKRRKSIFDTAIGEDGRKPVDPVTVLVMDDEKCSTELVYGIAIDSIRQTVNLTFRGSVTIRDWAADGDSIITLHKNKIRNPSNTIPQGCYVGIHRGFYNYMFQKRKNSPNKFDVIHGHLTRIFEHHPCSVLEVSGHSLGGSLATLFTFWSAFENRLNSAQWPIRCVAFASPRVGNNKFAKAFHELEIEGKICFLRVCNHRDVVTSLPNRPWIPSALPNDGVYTHVGVELRLYRNKEPKIAFPTIYKSRTRLFFQDVGLAIRYWTPSPDCLSHFGENVLKWHSCKEYMDRLSSRREELELLTLEDLARNLHRVRLRKGGREKSVSLNVNSSRIIKNWHREEVTSEGC